MKISKDKLRKLKGRAARAGKAAVGGSKATMFEGAAGAAAAYGGAILDEKVQFAADKPWLKGAVMVVAGHFAKKKASLRAFGAGLVGAGGYALGLHLRNRNSTPAAAPAAPAPSQTQGVYGPQDFSTADTGIVYTTDI